MHVLGDLGQNIVVEANVRVEQVVNGADVVLVFSPAVAELLGAEVCKH